MRRPQGTRGHQGIAPAPSRKLRRSASGCVGPPARSREHPGSQASLAIEARDLHGAVSCAPTACRSTKDRPFAARDGVRRLPHLLHRHASAGPPRRLHGRPWPSITASGTPCCLARSCNGSRIARRSAQVRAGSSAVAGLGKHAIRDDEVEVLTGHASISASIHQKPLTGRVAKIPPRLVFQPTPVRGSLMPPCYRHPAATTHATARRTCRRTASRTSASHRSQGGRSRRTRCRPR